MAIISYDTNALINLKDKAFKEHFFISSVVLEEIENIKSSRNKDEATKFNARRVADLLDEYEDRYDVIFYTKDISDFIMDTSNFATITNDTIICGSTAWYAKQNNVDVTFVTDDSICKSIAVKIFGLNTVSIHENNNDDYTGFVEKDVDEQMMADFYQDLNVNRFNLLPNQYLVIKSDGKVVDTLKWTGETHQNLKYSNIKSDYFGPVKPYQKDIYQAMALDSLLSNQVTMIRGFAGTGKSYLSIGTMFALLEKHKIDKIIVFCNTVATANSAKLG